MSVILPLLVFFLSAGLMIFARAKHWTIPEAFASADDDPPPPSTEAGLPFLTRHRWNILLAASVACILLFAIVFAPTRLTGEIPPDPNVPGRPFYSLHWGSAFLLNNFDMLKMWSAVLTSLVCLLPIVRALRLRSLLHAEIALLFSSSSLAISAQWSLAIPEFHNTGAALYVISALGLAYWAWLARTRLASDLERGLRSARPNWEIPLVLLILALTAYGRFYALESVPYGIEGDEAKWTSEAVNLGILGEPDSSGEYHRDALPISFYLQIPFHRLFGTSLISARATVAFLSVLASLMFYLLLRRIAPLPLAALATYLLAVSIFDISASRLANVESFVKFFGILPLTLLAWAISLRSLPASETPPQRLETLRSAWQPFALAGLALALAALTYDTLWPIVGIALLLTLIELWKEPAQEKLKALAALITPFLLTLPVIIPYFASRISYYELGEKQWSESFLQKLGERFTNVLDSWFVMVRPDFLYNREGPLLNAALLPWLAVGAVAALILVRQRSARWLLVWIALVVFPVPIVTDSALGRIFYPALPAVYGLVAFGLFLVWMEIQRIAAPALKPMFIAFALVPLVWLPLSNFYIYFNKVAEAGDRQMRREVSEIAARVTDDSTLLLLAGVPEANEPLNNEYQMIELFLLKHLTGEQIKRAYQHVALEETIPALFNEYANWDKIIIVTDKESSEAQEQRLSLTEGLAACFPRGTLAEGRHFDEFIIDADARAHANCTPTQLSLAALDSGALAWTLSAGEASTISLLCEKQEKNYFWLEAEEIELAPGWETEINFAPDWSGSGFLSDGYESQPMVYELQSNFDKDEIYVWARTFKRVLDRSPGMLIVNDVIAPFANASEDELNQWLWTRLGPFPNDETIRITIARPYEEDPNSFMAIFLDTLIITDDADLNPAINLTARIPTQRFVVTHAASGTFNPSLSSGQYICRAQAESQSDLVNSFGSRQILSNEIEIYVP